MAKVRKGGRPKNGRWTSSGNPVRDLGTVELRFKRAFLARGTNPDATVHPVYLAESKGILTPDQAAAAWWFGSLRTITHGRATIQAIDLGAVTPLGAFNVDGLERHEAQREYHETVRELIARFGYKTYWGLSDLVFFFGEPSSWPAWIVEANPPKFELNRRDLIRKALDHVAKRKAQFWATRNGEKQQGRGPTRDIPLHLMSTAAG